MPVQTKPADQQSGACPESTVDSAIRRDFVKKGFLSLARTVIPSPAKPAGSNCGFYCNVKASINVEVNESGSNSGTQTPGLTFGAPGSGEGISSTRKGCGPCVHGLTFWTGQQKTHDHTERRKCGNPSRMRSYLLDVDREWLYWSLRMYQGYL
jgi:hypothetical protein